MTWNLIVLSGEAGAGKDAVAKILVEDYDWVAYSLAAPMKRFCADMFGFTEEQLYGPSSARNAPDPRWARPCEVCEGTGFVPGTDIPHAPCGGTGKFNDNSPRRILQLMGEEFLRQMIHPDVLTMHAKPELIELHKHNCGIVINDARNPNDRDNLHDWLHACRVDVRSIRTKEIKEKDVKWRSHTSETRQPKDDEVEYIVQNDEEWPFPSLRAKVQTMLDSCTKCGFLSG